MSLTRRRLLQGLGLIGFSTAVVPSVNPQERNPFLTLLEGLQMSQKEMEYLEKRINNVGGVVRVFVHPYFMETDKTINMKDVDDVRRYAHIQDGFRRYVTSVTKNVNSAPLFIFEESSKLQATKKRMETEFGNLNGIYFIPTEEGSGVPKVSIFNPDSNLTFDQMTDQEVLASPMFEYLFKQYLGVKHVAVAGNYVDVVREQDGLRLVECVGELAERFKSLNIRVKFSRFVDTSREELHKKMR